MNWLNKLLCRIFGHDIDDRYEWLNNYTVCLRCGRQFKAKKNNSILIKGNVINSNITQNNVIATKKRQEATDDPQTL